MRTVIIDIIIIYYNGIDIVININNDNNGIDNGRYDYE